MMRPNNGLDGDGRANQVWPHLSSLHSDAGGLGSRGVPPAALQQSAMNSEASGITQCFIHTFTCYYDAHKALINLQCANP